MAVLEVACKMFHSRAGGGLVVLLWSCILSWWLCGASEIWAGTAEQSCGPSKMEVSFSQFIKGVAYSISVLDINGEFRDIHNDPDCGLLVKKRPKVLVVGAAYDGCYVRKRDGEYRMYLLLKEYVADPAKEYEMVKTCPVQTEAMYAPVPDVCSAVHQEDKLACGGTPITPDTCEEMGCCYSPNDASMPCFFGNKLTTQCTTDNQMVIAVSKDLTAPSLLMNSVKMIGLDSCNELSVARSGSFAVFRFPLSCGGASQLPGMPIIYENTIEATRSVQTWQGSPMTRDSTMRVTVRCIYDKEDSIPLAVIVNTLPPPPHVSTSGPLELEIRIAQDLGYTSYYTEENFPVVKVLRDPVYLEVRIIGRTDPNLVLVLNDCWATNSGELASLPQWPILIDSCPFAGDNYLSSLIPVGAPSQAVPLPNYYKRFLVNTFTFVDSSTQLALGGLVFFHCSASVCVPSAADNCVVTCSQRKRRMAEHQDLQSLRNTVTSQGPVAFLSVDSKMLKLAGIDASLYTTMDLAKTLATAGVIGAVAVLGLGLWIQHRNKMCNTKEANA